MGHSATFEPKCPLRSAATIRPFWPKCHQKHLILERAANRRNKKFKQVLDKKSMYSRPGTINHVADAIATDNGFWGTRQADSQIGDDTLAISTFFKIKPIR
jgi:hypothetical protein